MLIRSFVLTALLATSNPVLAQDSSLTNELSAIEGEILEVEAQISRYDSGIILSLAQARREALLLAKTVVENRINAEAGFATIEVAVPANMPDEDLANQLYEEMLAAQQRIEDAELEADNAGGLVRALALSRVETERLTLAQLRIGYLQARYGVAFPFSGTQPQSVEVEAESTVSLPEDPNGAGSALPWADIRYPDVDYTIVPFERAYDEGNEISGWWTVETKRAAVDDSVQVTAVNYSAYQPRDIMGLTALVARCVEGESAFIFLQDDFLISDFRRNSFEMTLRIDDNEPRQTRWSSLTSNKGAGLFGREAEEFIRAIYEADKLFIRLTENNGQRHDVSFDLAGARDAFEAVAGACGWTTLTLNQDDYRAIQSMLNAGGFDAGTPDGQWGPGSQAAMKRYQASVGLPETGAPDRATLEQLGIGQ